MYPVRSLGMSAQDVPEEPLYVNAKQYHRILKRRAARAKQEAESKIAKGRKPFQHLSRHLHALRRARGSGGRFANKPKDDAGKTQTEGNTELAATEKEKTGKDS